MLHVKNHSSCEFYPPVRVQDFRMGGSKFKGLEFDGDGVSLPTGEGLSPFQEFFLYFFVLKWQVFVHSDTF